jgi:hypothetical protein
MRTNLLYGFLLGLLLAGSAFSYEIVLKNGKTVKGTFISETEELIVLQDDSGVRINFKKSNVDLEKTSTANKVEPPPTTPAPVAEPAPAEEKVEGQEAVKPKKASRIFTERDLQRLRSKYPMEGGPGGSVETSSREPAGEKTEEYWRGASQELSAAMKQAEEAFQGLTRNCQLLKGATIQTHRVVNEKGETLNMAETTENYCQQADQAKAAYEQAKQDYESFLQEAKEENVPPGWIGQQ